jgi:hypothetical protein
MPILGRVHLRIRGTEQLRGGVAILWVGRAAQSVR